MKLNDLKPNVGSKKPNKRVGRGIAAGQGKTAGRGLKVKAHVLEVGLALITRAATYLSSAVCLLCGVKDLPRFTGWYTTKSILTSSEVSQRVVW